MPDLYTSRYANRELSRLDCVPVGITRGRPKFPTGYRYRLLELLAPSRQTFALASDEAFSQSYRTGLDEIGVDRIGGELRRISEEHHSKPLVLLCFEVVVGPRAEHCHRRDLARWWFEKTGQVVPELEDGMLPEIGPPAQEKLF